MDVWTHVNSTQMVISVPLTIYISKHNVYNVVLIVANVLPWKWLVHLMLKWENIWLTNKSMLHSSVRWYSKVTKWGLWRWKYI